MNGFWENCVTDGGSKRNIWCNLICNNTKKHVWHKLQPKVMMKFWDMSKNGQQWMEFCSKIGLSHFFALLRPPLTCCKISQKIWGIDYWELVSWTSDKLVDAFTSNWGGWGFFKNKSPKYIKYLTIRKSNFNFFSPAAGFSKYCLFALTTSILLLIKFLFLWIYKKLHL